MSGRHKTIAVERVSLRGRGDKVPSLYDIKVRVDAGWLLHELSAKAALNKAGRTVLGGGAVVIEATKVRGEA